MPEVYNWSTESYYEAGPCPIDGTTNHGYMALFSTPKCPKCGTFIKGPDAWPLSLPNGGHVLSICPSCGDRQCWGFPLGPED